MLLPDTSSLPVPVMILIFTGVGLAAQLIDGALGMAYGISSTTLLLSMGISPAVASASVHAAEVFTTGVSGLSHLGMGNIDKSLFRLLLLPGVVGAAAGALILTNIDGSIIKPFISAYLLVMGGMILLRLVRKSPGEEKRLVRNLGPLGFLGGFCDAVGGGGWGPIVTTTLIARGKIPRFTIGSVNSVEFFVTCAQTAVFISVLWQDMLEFWPVILGLLIGGVFAAPLAAYVAQRVPARVLAAAVGALICLLSMRTLLVSFF